MKEICHMSYPNNISNHLECVKSKEEIAAEVHSNTLDVSTWIRSWSCKRIAYPNSHNRCLVWYFSFCFCFSDTYNYHVTERGNLNKSSDNSSRPSWQKAPHTIHGERIVDRGEGSGTLLGCSCQREAIKASLICTCSICHKESSIAFSYSSNSLVRKRCGDVSFLPISWCNGVGVFACECWEKRRKREDHAVNLALNCTTKTSLAWLILLQKS